MPVCVCVGWGGGDEYGQEKYQVQEYGSKAEQLKVRKLLLIGFGKNKGCMGVNHTGNDAGKIGRDQIKGSLYILLRSLDFYFAHNGKTMEDFQGESDTIRYEF